MLAGDQCLTCLKAFVVAVRSPAIAPIQAPAIAAFR
jgi:hypothetical protein